MKPNITILLVLLLLSSSWCAIVATAELISSSPYQLASGHAGDEDGTVIVRSRRRLRNMICPSGDGVVYKSLESSRCNKVTSTRMKCNSRSIAFHFPTCGCGCIEKSRHLVTERPKTSDKKNHCPKGRGVTYLQATYKICKKLKFTCSEKEERFSKKSCGCGCKPKKKTKRPTNKPSKRKTSNKKSKKTTRGPTQKESKNNKRKKTKRPFSTHKPRPQTTSLPSQSPSFLPITSLPSRSPSFLPSQSPSFLPSQIPTLSPTTYGMVLRELIQSRSASTSFRDSASPQSSALSWLINDELSRSFLRDNNAYQVIQRFALATIWYTGTNGPSWNCGGSLQSWKSTCDWFRLGNKPFCSHVVSRYCSRSGEVIYLTLNMVSVMDGPLPAEIGLLTRLGRLTISPTSAVAVTIPSEIGLLTQLTALKVYNSLISTIPTEIGLLTQLRGLWVSNSLISTIPTEIGLFTQLVSLGFGGGATIPTEIGLLTQLDYLSFGAFTGGTIPTEIGLLTQLRYLESLSGAFAGTIPSEIGLLAQLESLELLNNAFAGTIPSEIGLLTQLSHMDFKANNLTSTIPTEIGLLTQLQFLDLANNSLVGTIPFELGLLTDQLRLLYLSYNNLSENPYLVPFVAEAKALGLAHGLTAPSESTLLDSLRVNSVVSVIRLVFASVYLNPIIFSCVNHFEFPQWGYA